MEVCLLHSISQKSVHKKQMYIKDNHFTKMQETGNYRSFTRKLLRGADGRMSPMAKILGARVTWAP